jgi:hypothetical protein
MNTLAMSNILSTDVQGKNKATGIKIAAKASSCLKALSSLKAYLRPFQELIAALNARVNPLLPL